MPAHLLPGTGQAASTRTMLRPRVQRVMEQVTGTVMIGLGIRLAVESR